MSTQKGGSFLEESREPGDTWIKINLTHIRQTIFNNVQNELQTTNFVAKLYNNIIDFELKDGGEHIVSYWGAQYAKYPEKFKNITENNSNISFFNGYSMKGRIDSIRNPLPLGMTQGNGEFTHIKWNLYYMFQFQNLYDYLLKKYMNIMFKSKWNTTCPAYISLNLKFEPGKPGQLSIPIIKQYTGLPQEAEYMGAPFFNTAATYQENIVCHQLLSILEDCSKNWRRIVAELNLPNHINYLIFERSLDRELKVETVGGHVIWNVWRYEPNGDSNGHIDEFLIKTFGRRGQGCPWITYNGLLIDLISSDLPKYYQSVAGMAPSFRGRSRDDEYTSDYAGEIYWNPSGTCWLLSFYVIILSILNPFIPLKNILKYVIKKRLFRYDNLEQKLDPIEVISNFRLKEELLLRYFIEFLDKSYAIDAPRLRGVLPLGDEGTQSGTPVLIRGKNGVPLCGHSELYVHYAQSHPNFRQRRLLIGEQSTYEHFKLINNIATSPLATTGNGIIPLTAQYVDQETIKPVVETIIHTGVMSVAERRRYMSTHMAQKEENAGEQAYASEVTTGREGKIIRFWNNYLNSWIICSISELGADRKAQGKYSEKLVPERFDITRLYIKILKIQLVQFPYLNLNLLVGDNQIGTIMRLIPAELPPVYLNNKAWQRVWVCAICEKSLSWPRNPRHHCRGCGNSVCGNCSPTTRELMTETEANSWLERTTNQKKTYTKHRVCVNCSEEKDSARTDYVLIVSPKARLGRIVESVIPVDSIKNLALPNGGRLVVQDKWDVGKPHHNSYSLNIPCAKLREIENHMLINYENFCNNMSEVDLPRCELIDSFSFKKFEILSESKVWPDSPTNASVLIRNSSLNIDSCP